MTHTLSYLTKHRRKPTAVIALLCWVIVGGTLSAGPQSNKHDKWLTEHLPSVREDELIPVIVTVKPGANENVTNGLQKRGYQRKRDFGVVSGFSAELPRKAIAALDDDSDVVNLSFDAPVTASSVTSATGGRAKNSPYSLRSTLGISGTKLTGNGVTVAVIDSGIYPAPDFGDRIVKFIDFTRGGVSVSPMDPYGHGTHVAGIIAGAASEVPGLASNVKLIGLRVLDAQGTGSTSNVIAAIEWATNNRVAYKIDILNLSLGHQILEPAANDPLVQAVETAVRSGLVVVVSAGNVGLNTITGVQGYAGILSPGNAPSAITVGVERTFATNTRSDDVVAEYSSRGPTWLDAYAKPDLVAPGHFMLSVSDKTQNLYIGYPELRGPSALGGREYMYLSGTSMSAAVVSGSVALMIEASRVQFPGWNGAPSTRTARPNAIKAMLMNSAFKLGDATGLEYDVLTQGAGALNAGGAVTLSQSLDPGVSSGRNWLVGGLTQSSVIDGQTISWANRIVWDDQLVWGNVLYDNGAAWDNRTVWGADIFWGANVIARQLVWGNQNVWGNQIVWGNMKVVATARQIVWGNQSMQANSRQIVWGNQLVGANARQIVWGNVDVAATAKQIVWGNSVLTTVDNTLGAVIGGK